MSPIKNFWQRNYIFLSLLLVTLPFRLYHFTYPILDAFNFRQAQTATFALNFYKNGINLFRTELDIFGMGKERFLTLEFPLYESIVAIFYRVFFFSDTWGRMVSIIAGFLGAWYLYQLIKLILKSEKIALFSSFFFLFAPLNMFYQRAFMIESTVIALLLAGIFYFCHWVNNQDKKSYLLSVIFLTLGFIHKGLYGPFWLLPMTIYYLRRFSLRAIHNLKFCLAIAIPLSVLFLWQKHVNHINMVVGHEFFTTYNPGHQEWNLGYLSERFSWPDWQFRLRQILNGIFLKPGLFLFLVGLLMIIKLDTSSFLLGLFFSQVVYFLVLFRIQKQNYYQMIMVPAFSIFISMGLIKIAGWAELLVKKFIKIKYLGSYVGTLCISFFCVFFVYKSWVNTLPSFYIDWEWYRRLILVGKTLPSDAVGILATPGVDWNSVYTYIPRKKMLQVSAENVSLENIQKWKKMGYSFVVLHEYEKYSDYFAKIKPGYSLDFLEKYKKILDIEEFRVYLLH